MRGARKNLAAVLQALNELTASGRLGNKENLLIRRQLKQLSRAMAIKDEKLVRKAVDEICRVFVKKVKEE